ncbi:MAG: hypothetical protein RL732_739, partial [Bacteroidota bacterium]
MLLIIIGVLLLAAAQVLHRSSENLSRFSTTARTIGLVAVLTGILSACVIQIEAGQAGVKKLFGKVQSDVLSSGLHFINPLLVIERM